MFIIYYNFFHIFEKSDFSSCEHQIDKIKLSRILNLSKHYCNILFKLLVTILSHKFIYLGIIMMMS